MYAKAIDYTMHQRQAKRLGRVLLCFPEEAATNGKGILCPAACRTDPTASVHIVSIDYTTAPRIPAPLHQSIVFAFFRIIAASLRFGLNEVVVTFVRRSDIPLQNTTSHDSG